MINKLSLYISDRFDPYYNMSVEKYLTVNAAPGECVLFLWRNERTVFIGRNQNCWAECRVSALEADGGHLCRRLSGGGAVYHDIGNLNFTFALSCEDFDPARQASVIARAVGKYGISAEVSGRNDILTRGCKFSGCAFWRCGSNNYHHGTILIKTDVEEMERYLSVPADKLKAKGVASVRSRVINLSTLNSSVTPEGMISALREAFGEVYQLEVCQGDLPSDNDVADIRAEFESAEWKYGRTPEFSHELHSRYLWGGITLGLVVRDGVIADLNITSDALDTEFIDKLGRLLLGVPYSSTDICRAIMTLKPTEMAEDVCEMIKREL